MNSPGVSIPNLSDGISQRHRHRMGLFFNQNILERVKLVSQDCVGFSGPLRPASSWFWLLGRKRCNADWRMSLSVDLQVPTRNLWFSCVQFPRFFYRCYRVLNFVSWSRELFTASTRWISHEKMTRRSPFFSSELKKNESSTSFKFIVLLTIKHSFSTQE